MLRVERWLLGCTFAVSLSLVGGCSGDTPEPLLTCGDGVKNGIEVDVDCGGTCVNGECWRP